jgi:hypothetical protein
MVYPLFDSALIISLSRLGFEGLVPGPPLSGIALLFSNDADDADDKGTGGFSNRRLA